jgi:hypothetical protein
MSFLNSTRHYANYFASIKFSKNLKLHTTNLLDFHILGIKNDKNYLSKSNKQCIAAIGYK